MAKSKGYKQPVPKVPYANFEPGASTTSKVTNRVNTGQSSSSTQTTGATGAVSNVVKSTSVQGKAGAPGTVKTTTGGAGAASTSTQATPTTRPISRTATAPAAGNPTPPEAQTAAAIAAARSQANTQLNAAVDRTGTQLADARQKALEAVRAANAGPEWEKRVNDAFDRADETVKKHKRS